MRRLMPSLGSSQCCVPLCCWTDLGHVAAGLVVNAGVDDTAVVARLMGGPLALLFQDADGLVGELLRDEARGGKANNARADHDHIVAGNVDWEGMGRGCQAGNEYKGREAAG